MKFRLALIIAIVAAFSVGSFAQAPPDKAERPITFTAKLPTAKEIVDRHVKAIGGRSAVEKIKSRTMSGTVEISPMGVKGTFETLMAAPGQSISKMTLAGIGDMFEGYDGTTAWSQNPIQGGRDKSGAELLQSKNSNDFYRDIRLEKIYPKMTVTGVEKFGDKDAYAVRAEPVGLNPEILYFDFNSGLLIGTNSELISPEGIQKAKVFYDEYKPYDGVMVVTKMRSVLPQAEIKMVVTDVKNNTPVDQAKFAKPKS